MLGYWEDDEFIYDYYDPEEEYDPSYYDHEAEAFIDTDEPQIPESWCAP